MELKILSLKSHNYSAPDYVYKSALLACGAVKTVREWLFACYFWQKRGEQLLEGKSDTFYTMSSIPANLLFDEHTFQSIEKGMRYMGISETDSDFLECKKILHASYKRTSRLKCRIRQMLTSGPCSFVTFTFNEEYLNKTTENERKRAVRRWLDSLHCKYICNVDYGKKNGREHYHCVLNMAKIPLERLKRWYNNKGAIFSERVRIYFDEYGQILPKSYIKLAKYVNKLTNHAIKETAKRQVIMYSRSDWEDKIAYKCKSFVYSSLSSLTSSDIRDGLTRIRVLSPFDVPMQLNFLGDYNSPRISVPKISLRI